MPYPKDFMSPKIKTFNGKQGNDKDHLMKFIMSLGVYGPIDYLKSKELLNFLIENVYA
jgi:hypothetical protein